MKNLILHISLVSALCSCSGMSNTTYLDRKDIAELRGTNNIDEIKYSDYGSSKKITTYGAIMVNRFDEVTGADDPMVFDIKRTKSRLYAETKLSESDNKEKTTFDETIFNVGLDTNNKGLSAELTLKF